MGKRAQLRPRLFKRGEVYWCDVRGADGRRLRVSTGQRDEALAVQAAANIAAQHSMPPAQTLHAALERTYLTHWSRTRSATVLRNVVNMLQRQLGALHLHELNFARLEHYCQQCLEGGTSPATVNRRMSAIGRALRDAVDRGELSVRPRMPHYAEDNLKDRYLTLDEEQGVLDYLQRKAEVEKIMLPPGGQSVWQFMADLVVFLLDSGLRFSEAFAFTLTDDGCADLTSGKTRSSRRRVPLTPRALTAAKAILGSYQYKHLKELPGKKPWDWCSHRFGRAAKAAGCPDVTLHILRHTCASRMIQRGVPIYVVSKFLGHSSVRVTERYAKLNADSLRTAMQALANP
jgi:integrase